MSSSMNYAPSGPASQGVFSGAQRLAREQATQQTLRGRGPNAATNAAHVPTKGTAMTVLSCYSEPMREHAEPRGLTSRPPTELAIEVSHLSKSYGPTVAVEDVSFSVGSGEIFGVIGPNGAGKTTAVECVGGLRTRDSGTVSVLGLDPQSTSAAPCGRWSASSCRKGQCRSACGSASW